MSITSQATLWNALEENQDWKEQYDMKRYGVDEKILAVDLACMLTTAGTRLLTMPNSPTNINIFLKKSQETALSSRVHKAGEVDNPCSENHHPIMII